MKLRLQGSSPGDSFRIPLELAWPLIPLSVRDGITFTLPVIPHTISTVRLCFVTFDMTLFAGDTACSDFACTRASQLWLCGSRSIVSLWTQFKELAKVFPRCRKFKGYWQLMWLGIHGRLVERWGACASKLAMLTCCYCISRGPAKARIAPNIVPRYRWLLVVYFLSSWMLGIQRSSIETLCFRAILRRRRRYV